MLSSHSLPFTYIERCLLTSKSPQKRWRSPTWPRNLHPSCSPSLLFPLSPFFFFPLPPPLLIKSGAPCRIIRFLIQSEFQELVCLVTCHSISACHISGDRWLYLICFKQFHWVLVYKSFRNGIDTCRLS